MSNNTRNGLTVFLLVLLAGVAFGAGYFVNDMAGVRRGSAQSQADFDLFWEAWDRVEGSFIGELPQDQERTYGAIRGSLAEIDDPYTVFIEPVAREIEREELQGRFGGIGAFVSRPEEGGDVVLEPIPGNPAEAAGVLSGDILLAVDGVEILPELTVEEITALVKGEIGTAVTLTVLHPGASEPVDIEVVRGDILLPSVTYNIVEEDPTIGYVRLARFSGESSGEVAEALQALQEQGAQRFILDVRQNRGGLLDAAVSVADLFLTDGPILYQTSKTEGEQAFNASADTLVPEAPLVVLIDGGTASAAEIVAGALNDRERATLVGPEPSFGKGSVQIVFDLSDGSSVHVTSARWLTPSRKQLDGDGLAPDVLVELTQEALENGRDEVLERAVKFLQETTTP